MSLASVARDGGDFFPAPPTSGDPPGWRDDQPNAWPPPPTPATPTPTQTSWDDEGLFPSPDVGWSAASGGSQIWDHPHAPVSQDDEGFFAGRALAQLPSVHPTDVSAPDDSAFLDDEAELQVGHFHSWRQPPFDPGDSSLGDDKVPGPIGHAGGQPWSPTPFGDWDDDGPEPPPWANPNQPWRG